MWSTILLLCESVDFYLRRTFFLVTGAILANRLKRSSALSRFTRDKCPNVLALRKFNTLSEMWLMLFWSRLDTIWKVVDPWVSSRKCTRFTLFFFDWEESKLKKSSLSTSASWFFWA